MRISPRRGTVNATATLPRGQHVQLIPPAPGGSSMCLSVRYADTISHPYDADHGVITVPSGLSPRLTLRAVKAVLAELHIPQSALTPICWCGQPVDLSGRVPAQRTGEVIRRGA